MDSWDNVEVILFLLFAILVVVGLSNRGFVPYVNPARGLNGPRTPINGKW